MPAHAGIQGRQGMDTGFRRYDGTWFNSSSHRLHIYFEGETKSVKLAKKKSETFVSAMKKNRYTRTLRQDLARTFCHTGESRYPDGEGLGSEDGCPRGHDD